MKTISISNETHQKIDEIRVRTPECKTFEDVIKMLIEEWNE